MNTYFKRYAYPDQLFTEAPDPEVKIIVVIPCFNEPDITSVLNSLNNCISINKVEVILVINEAINAREEVTKNNLKTLAEAENWKQSMNPWFNLLINFLRLPEKHAGVGLARKAGMDEAARRFEAINRKKGLIACYDADSTCSKDYFTALYEAYYNSDHQPVGSSIYFEHPFPAEPEQQNGIIQYELHLRYYVHALRWINYPYAFQTVGSSMVVRSDIYQKIGGMNKKKAGEDFYFLHRLIPAGLFTDINSTVIYPSPRISQRVPFGTGKAMEKWQQDNSSVYFTYNLKSFEALGRFFKQINSFYETPMTHPSDVNDEAITHFLENEDFTAVLQRIKKQSRSLSQFRKQFFTYFDGFKVLKYLHFSRDHYNSNAPVIEESIKLAAIRWPDKSLTGETNKAVLNFYRNIDRLS